MRLTGVAAVLFTLASVGPAAGQLARRPEDGGLTASLGQPRNWHRHAGAGVGWINETRGSSLVVEGRFGLYSDLGNPLWGLGGVQFEVYSGARGTDFDYGFRTQFVSPTFRFGAGIDINGLDREAYLLLSVFHPVRRGGILGGGTELRLNYLPGRLHSFSAGLEIPVGRRINMGQTRPRSAVVELATPRVPPVRDGAPDPPGLAESLSALAESAHWITRTTLPFLEQGAFGPVGDDGLETELLQLRSYFDARAAAHGSWAPQDEVRRFHAEMERAFSIAAGAADPGPGAGTVLGRRIADQARSIILEEVLLPYDRLLGRVKQPDSLAPFAVRARGVFVRWLHTGSPVPPDRVWSSLRIFTELLAILERQRRFQHDRWGDSRFVWLPLQFALLPEQHDSQAEVDALVEKAGEVPFRDGNGVWYLINEQFALQLSRTLHAARDYHVLWIHDVKGLDAQGHPDEMTYRIILGAYLATLTQRVREYDVNGTFPVFMIFLDQWYYEKNRSRFWMDLLEDPLRHEFELPEGFAAWQDSIAAAQAELRRAVEESRLLQDQAQQYGRDWLRDLVRIHVSITNPADPSFWSNGLVPIFGMPDDVARDHRKIAFYDITEEDPYRGEAIYTGAGVGTQYTTLDWEDRSILARGPALLTLKDAARELLLNQGIEPDRIPWALTPRPLAADYEARIRAHVENDSVNVRALEVHNQTGHSPKPLDVVKATLYTMMPGGSVIIVPDGLWAAGFWGGMLVGHSLRGGRTLVIAPGPESAPARGMGSVAKITEVVSRIQFAADVLGPGIEARGGLLRVGIYSPEFEVSDLGAKVAVFLRTLRTVPWFADLYRLAPVVVDEMERLAVELRDQNGRWQRTLDLGAVGRPRLHLKTNYFASAEAWEGLLRLPDWSAVLREYLERRVRQIEKRDRALENLDASVPDVIHPGQRMLDEWIGALDPVQRERLVFYFLLGSSNQDYRSMVLDGEVGFLAAGTSVNASLIDLVAFTGHCHWVESREDLATMLPEPGPWTKRLVRWLRLLI